MESKLHKIFNKDKNIIIGAIHFPPLVGYPDFPGFEAALKDALDDLRAFQGGGVDGVIIENNYDIPHKIQVLKETVDIMIELGKKIRAATELPLGVSVLWNDYQAAFTIAKKIGAQFIRVPVFVDKVKTDYGIVDGNPEKVTTYRKNIGAENIAIFTDIHVKHAKILNKENNQQIQLIRHCVHREDSTDEGQLRKKYIEQVRKCISISVNPSSPDPRIPSGKP